MNGWINVTWCPNPLRQASDRQVRPLLLSGTDTVESVIKRLALQGTSLVAVLNGVTVPKKRWNRKCVRTNDILVLQQQAHGFEAWATAELAMSGKTIAEAEFLAAVATVALNVAASLALSYLATEVFGSQRNAANTRKDPDGYSIEGGSNQQRQYGPLPVVLGSHRLFADYGSRPFTEFVNDPSATISIINGTMQAQDETPPPFAFGDSPPADPYTPIWPWVLISGSPPDTLGYYGDQAARSYDSPGGHADAPHTFVMRTNGSSTPEYTTWENYMTDTDFPATWVSSGAIPVIDRYGYDALVNVERLTNIFNFGFGDLAVTNLMIGTTAIEEFTNWQRNDSSVPAGQADHTVLQGYSCPNWVGTDYPTHVVSADGAQLQQHENVPNDGWVTRQGIDGCYYMQIDLFGRLFHQGDNGPENLSCEFEAQYRVVGAADWIDCPFSPLTVTNGITTPVRETYRFYAPAPAKYELRMRRLTADSTDARSISELTLSNVKFFIQDSTLYPAQKRMALMVQATGQLNGQLDRLSALVTPKHWLWNSASAWSEGAYPGSDARWSWTATSNPAALFLYYARGGFLNSAAAPAYMGGAQGWLDHPDPSNGLRLFGAGLTDSKIDYAAIVAWGQFCTANGLECHMVIDSQRPCAEVLDDIAAAGWAKKNWAPGKLSVVWEAPDQPTIAVFGMPNIAAGSFQITYNDDNTIDEYVLDFTDSANDFAADSARAVVPGVAQPTNPTNIKAAYAMPKSQAQQAVNRMAVGRFYRRRSIQWETTREAMMIQRGDVVALAHDLTQWAYSGRLIGLTAVDGNITGIETSCKVDAVGGEEFYVWLRRPHGTFRSVQCIPPAERTTHLVVVSAWPASDAPAELSVGEANKDSAWADTIPEDWMFLAGPTATPGKRVRISAIEPAQNMQFRITATDEYAEYFVLAAGGAAADVTSGERLVARAFNLGIETDDAGKKLVWELENAHGAEVMVSVNGGVAAQVPVQGYLSVVGEELLLPDYAAGTRLDIHVLPVAAGTPVAIEGDRIVIEVPETSPYVAPGYVFDGYVAGDFL